MKLSRHIIILLLTILLVTLLVATFIGTTFQTVTGSVKEGIEYNKLAALNVILENTNETNTDSNIVAIKSMVISDSDFSNVIESGTLSNSQQIVLLKNLSEALSKNKLKNDSLLTTLDDNITLRDGVKEN